MKEEKILDYNNSITSTQNINYSNSLSSITAFSEKEPIVISDIKKFKISEDVGKYSVTDIANWFLQKEDMTHKKLQKMCYYAQAWSYAINEYRLLKTDFQAWVHGPVSPVLYEKFKGFGFDPIHLKANIKLDIDSVDMDLLEDVWETYGDKTGNALEALSHSELPWKAARKGYAPNESSNVIISPELMKEYYSSIYSRG